MTIMSDEPLNNNEQPGSDGSGQRDAGGQMKNAEYSEGIRQNAGTDSSEPAGQPSGWSPQQETRNAGLTTGHAHSHPRQSDPNNNPTQSGWGAPESGGAYYASPSYARPVGGGEPYGRAGGGQSNAYGAGSTMRNGAAGDGNAIPSFPAPFGEDYGFSSAGFSGAEEKPKKEKKQHRGPGWTALIVATLAAGLVGGGMGASLTGIQGGGVRPAKVEQTQNAESATSPVVEQNGTSPDWQAVAQAVEPAVVAIDARAQGGSSAGSGVVIDEAGHILTNDHVISSANELYVTLADGRIYRAELTGTDPTTDLAVIQLQDPPQGLTIANFGDSSDLQVGQEVAAIGNPLGLSSTMTTGIISALNRPVQTQGEQQGRLTTQGSQVVTNAIQLDAAVNPGNSGGPLFDASGKVIGITSSIASITNGGSQAGSIGLGFAIPINLAKNVSQQLIESGVAEHAFLGVSITDGIASANGENRLGAEVQHVEPGGPAQRGGIQVGDVVTKVNDLEVSGATSLTGYVRQFSTGDVVTLTFVRDGKLQETDVTLAVRKDS
ncbi:MAG: trypsin-like peptidase domain-containing protein [Actinomycetaceae bacterium]|nr:trypsin-like peptidase domain-containing protein [Arcanobacterium sp.]MDD7505227.1 trypsin-like peptidase domain-containing protein [Actinomycetaceae bacterium]MDY6143315.1 trypsin-like peptidase domain-containing protein [Arcanobacterium sp.]